MDKRYHVYISSTLADLKTERNILSGMVRELGHTPVLMDSFDDEDTQQWELIKKSIEDSDYMLVLLAKKYHSQGDTGSRVEKEYLLAQKLGMPVLALLIGDKVKRSESRTEKDREGIKKLAQFRDRLKNHPHETWTNAVDLFSRAQTLLIRQITLNPRQGWVRAGEVISPALANELGRLSSENARLKAELKAENPEIMDRIKAKMRYTLRLLAANKETIGFFYSPGSKWENPRNFRYLKLFRLLAPELYEGKTIPELSKFLGSVLNPDLSRRLRGDFPTPSNSIKRIITAFRAFKLAGLENGGGEEEQWKLSEYGKALYSYYKIRQFERAAKHQGSPVQEEGPDSPEEAQARQEL
jgi:hypothetical protein